MIVCPLVGDCNKTEYLKVGIGGKLLSVFVYFR